MARCTSRRPLEDIEAHYVSSYLQPKVGHVLLVKVKGCVAGHMFRILQCKHAAVAAIGLVWDVCRESARTTRTTLPCFCSRCPLHAACED